MASRFEIVDEKYIEELKDKSENESKGKARSTGRTFSNLEVYESDALDQTLSQFYAKLRKKTGMTMSPTA